MISESDLSGSGANGDAQAPLTEQAKQQAQKVLQQTQQKAGDVLGQTQSQIKSRLESQKGLAADGLENVALAVRQTGQHLREQEQQSLGERADMVAGAVENFSGYLRRTDVDQFVGGVQNFGRSQPALFLGTAFALGFLAARFLRSSSQGATAASGGAPDRLLPVPIDQQIPATGPVDAMDTDISTAAVRTTDDAPGTTNF